MNGQVAVEFMAVVPWVLLLFAATIELAVYCVKGELFLLSSFHGHRTAEVRGESEWALVGSVADRFLDTGMTMTTNPGFTEDGEGFRSPQSGQITLTHTYRSLTGFQWPASPNMLRDAPLTFFPHYKRSNLEDNCLPGFC